MQAPILKSLTVQTPGGLTSTLTTTRAVSLSNPADPLSLATQTDTLVINGRTYTSTYTQATRLLSTTTPQGRTSQVTLDAKGRVIQEQVTGLEPVSYSYDALGRLATITQGTGVDARTSTLTYNSKCAYRVDSERYSMLYVVGPWTPEARPRRVWKAAIGVRRRLKRKANSSR